MDPERWRNIEKLYESVVERSPAERAALLAQADPDIRAEVELLLAQPGGGALLDQQVADLLGESDLSQLAAGTRLGHYQIVAMLGRGGMGVVYRAKDTKLGREVAIKVLPDSLAQDPDRLARFNREAKLLASLNHPNIGHIYGVESQALVIELVEGETLGSIIKSGALPIETVLNHARQIAEALEAAHEKGIIHRDLKPANIMVTREGLIKVLDFGLAKSDVPPTGSDPAQSPTLLLSPTRTGIILGTAAYMSPEQASGKAADRRTDIWSFGAVLYEMLSGQAAFRGESVAEILAGVLRGEPDWGALPKGTPPRIRSLLPRCMDRDRERRVQAIREARIELHATIAEQSDSRSALRVIKRYKVVLVSIAVVAALATPTWFLLHRPPKPAAEPTQKRLTFNSSENPVQSLAISPDGKYLAYSDPAGIHVKLLSTSEERVIPRPTGVPTNTYWQVDSWFPDGTRLLADASEPGGHKSIWTISVVGQNPRHLRDGGTGFAVSPDGTQIAYGQSGTTDDIRELWVMGIEGDNPHKVLTVETPEWLQWGQWSPDGKRLAYIRYRFTSGTEYHSSIETYDLERAHRAVVVDTDLIAQGLCWLPQGRIIFARHESLGSPDFNLWQRDVNNQAGTPVGKANRITAWVGSKLSALSASADGKRLSLLKQTDQSNVYLAELEPGGRSIKSSHRFTNDEAEATPFAWTPDSKAVLLNSNRNGTEGIYKQEISSDTPDPLFTAESAALPRVTPDGAWVLFMTGLTKPTRPGSAYHLMRMPLSGGAPQLVMEMPVFWDYECAKTPAGICVTFEPEKQFLVREFDPRKGRGKVLRALEMSTEGYAGSLSPDGSTCALAQIGESEIHIRLVSLSGGLDREITVKGWPNTTNLDFSSDGQGLYCGSSSPLGNTLLYVDLMGNARVLWKNKGGVQIWGIPSPDGRYLAIGTNVRNSNVWMLEGF